MNTFSQIVQRCVTRLGMAGGTGVQVYAEDIIAEMVQARFDEMFESTWWEDYMDTQTVALVAGGSTGLDLPTLWSLKKFTDIKHVYYTTNYYPLKLLPGRSNPNIYADSDATPEYLYPKHGNEVFQVLPYGTVGESVTVVFRARPDNFLADDVVIMDAQALIYGTCYDYLADDASNPIAIEKFRNFYNERLEQLNSSRNEQDIDIMPPSGGIDDWHEY
jgi:hypothetical protein